MKDLLGSILHLESDALGFPLSILGLFILSMVCMVFKMIFSRK